MQLTVLSVPGCPNVALLEERLAPLLAGRPGVTVTRRVIATAEEAARSGMHGSPTILVDGVDPFAGPGAAASLSCRLYREQRGPSRRRPVGGPAPPGDRRAPSPPA